MFPEFRGSHVTSLSIPRDLSPTTQLRAQLLLGDVNLVLHQDQAALGPHFEQATRQPQ